MTFENGWRARLILLTIICALSPLSMALVVPALPSMADSLQLDMKEIQFMLSAFLIGLGVAQPIHGILADRFGRRRVLLFGFFLFVTACLLTLVVTHWWTLIVLRGIQGAGVSAGTITSRAMITDLQERETAAISFSYLSIGMTMGALLAPVLGAWLVLEFGWKSIFVFSTLAGLAIITLSAFTLRESLPAELATKTLRFKPVFKNYAILFRSTVFVGFTLMFAFSQGMFFSFLPVGADFFMRELHQAEQVFIVYWLLVVSVYILGSVLCASMLKRRGMDTTAAFACKSLLLVGLLMLIFFVGVEKFPWLPLVALIPAMFFCGMTTPLALNGAVAAFPALAGAAAGLSSALGMVAGGLFSMVSGMLYDQTLVPMLVLTCASAFGTYLVLFLIRMPRTEVSHG